VAKTGWLVIDVKRRRWPTEYYNNKQGKRAKRRGDVKERSYKRKENKRNKECINLQRMVWMMGDEHIIRLGQSAPV